MSKKSRIEEDDVLPVELIHRIQSLLLLKEAASTCILSRSWLRAWYTIPTLRLIPPEPDKLFSTVENAAKYNKLIHTTLQRYDQDNMPIESFYLRLNIEDNCLNPEDVENWIRLAVSNSCLKALSLNIGVFTDDFILPNELFSSQSLHKINVTAAVGLSSNRLRICTNPPVINCVSLRVLDLEYVVITENVFYNLLSTCTLLEKIKLSSCVGLKNVKVKNILRLSKLDIYSREKDDFWEMNNVPSLCSFRYRTEVASRKLMPFQIDSLGTTVTELCIKGVIIDNSFFDTLEAKFSALESLTLGIDYWEHRNMVITCASLKWLTLDLSHTGLVVNVQVDAPRLLSFIYTGKIPGLLFRTTAPEQVKFTFDSCDNLGHLYFQKMREALNLSSKFDINIRHNNLDLVVPLNIDVDHLRSRVLFPVGNVQLTLETCLDEHVWEKSRFFDAFFSVCHPSYLKSSYEVIRKMMEANTTDLKEVLLKNPRNGKWEALTSFQRSILHTFPGYRNLECKLTWFPL